MIAITRRAMLAGLGAASLTRGWAAGIPRSAFDAQSTAEEVTSGVDLTGRTVVITGCTSGLGFESMRVLALRGAHVIGTGRTLAQASEAAKRVRGYVTPLALELTDFPSVVDCAAGIRSFATRVDVLMLNAGIVLDRPAQVRGLERQFVVNHLGHFLFASRLMDLVRAAPQGRVVTVGSGSHFDAPKGGIRFDDLSGKGWESRAYAHSKLANGLYSLELARRLRGTAATSNCLTPGAVHTAIFDGFAQPVKREAKTAAEGAATQCYVATSPALREVTGAYFKDCNPSAQSPDQQDARMAARLWDVSEQLTRAYLA